MSEKWKAIKGYEGLYEASSLGRIRSLKRTSTSGRVLKQYVSPHNGYCYVSLCKDNRRISKRVHKLVYTAFYGWEWGSGYHKEHTIDHIDGDKTNNRIDNLEVCTQSENQKRAYKKGLNPVFSKMVIDLTTGQIFDSVLEAANSVRTGANGAAVSRVCKGRRSQYRNHKFAYYDDYLKNTIPQFRGRAKESCKKLWVE